ncbi:MAG TPA: hypothetical protein VFV67_22930 [Actinophytocola sp.]|uniref:hypothetical protein n=1 Tax=Actinophytocola sp. TaxID=1872138 RepID=UPI002DBC10DD|nr:hypothetical protein [Actinophytocola sp.]HEU5473510.1 hypothetical protein [Actinophytocola sp.]
MPSPTVLLGAAAGAVDLARWAVRPALALARAGVPDWLTTALDRRGREAQADLEHAADVVLRWVVLRVLTISDLTRMIQEHLDLNLLAEGLDVDEVISRLDLPTIAQEVIDSVDLPAIVRESSETVASEALAGVRSQAMQADDAVSHLFDKILRR